jgi:site-specific DNA-adenine methylase
MAIKTANGNMFSKIEREYLKDYAVSRKYGYVLEYRIKSKLQQFYRLKLSDRGCKVLHSNSNSKEVRDLFSKEWKIIEVAANRSINSDSTKRTGQKELLIKNY